MRACLLTLANCLFELFWQIVLKLTTIITWRQELKELEKGQRIRKPPPNVPDRSTPEPTPARPVLKTGEFLLADTIEGVDGVLRFVSNRIPAAGTLVEFYELGQKRMAIPFLDGRRQGTALTIGGAETGGGFVA